MAKREIKILGIPVYKSTTQETEARSYEDSMPLWAQRLWGLQSESGMRVNQETSLTFSAVWACVRILANTVAMPSLNVYKHDGESKTKDTTHPIQRIIHSEPNGMMSSFQWRQTMQAHAALRGNAYSIIHRDNSMRPAELEFIDDPDKVDVFSYDRKVYYRVSGNPGLIPGSDMFHIKGLSFDGLKGKSVLQVARESFGAALAMQDYQNKLYKNGGSTRIALKTDQILKPETKQNMRDSWTELYGGPDNQHKVAILEGGLNVQNIGISPKDIEFIASHRFSVEEVARYFGMILDLLATDNKQSYASVEQRAIDFIKYTMMPWYKTWESEIDRKLFRESEKGKYYSKFNIDSLLRGDSAARAQFYKDMFYIGAISRNEIRSLEDLNAIDEDGDKFYMQVNMQKAENIGKELENTIENE